VSDLENETEFDPVDVEHARAERFVDSILPRDRVLKVLDVKPENSASRSEGRSSLSASMCCRPSEGVAPMPTSASWISRLVAGLTRAMTLGLPTAEDTGIIAVLTKIP
jgi:hypothetical protein